jgi:hypothetical protein
MDETRDDKLMQRPGTARFDAEANDLGRLVADERGETYGGAAAGGAPFDEAEPRNSARVSTWRERAPPRSTTRTSRRLIQTQLGA